MLSTINARHGHLCFILAIMANEYPCIKCLKNVTRRMHAVSCDGCGRWQHRKCDTGITSEQYRLMSSGQLTMEWSCGDCNVDSEVRQLSSTTVYDEEPSKTTFKSYPAFTATWTTLLLSGSWSISKLQPGRRSETCSPVV